LSESPAITQCKDRIRGWGNPHMVGNSTPAKTMPLKENYPKNGLIVEIHTEITVIAKFHNHYPGLGQRLP